MKLKGTELSGRKARVEYCLENPQKEKKISFVIVITHHFFSSFQTCADLEGGLGYFFNLHFKITKNMPRSPWQTQITIAIRSLSWLYEIKFFKKKNSGIIRHLNKSGF